MVAPAIDVQQKGHPAEKSGPVSKLRGVVAVETFLPVT
jgi:hypothetical protein